MNRLKLLLVSNCHQLACSLTAALQNHPDIRLQHIHTADHNLWQALADEEPNVVLLSATLPGEGVEALCSRIRCQHPQTAVLILAPHYKAWPVEGAVMAGASGWLLQTSAPALLVKAVIDVSEGHEAWCPEARQIAHGMRLGYCLHHQLDEMDRQLVQLSYEAKTCDEMGKLLFISPDTAKRKRWRIYEVLGVKDQFELAKISEDLGLVQRPVRDVRWWVR